MGKTLAALVTAGLVPLLASAGAAASPQTVTISASRPAVVFGKSVTLSGKISDSKPSENVNVLAEPFGTTAFGALAAVQTVSGGHWSEVVKPTIQTSYQATWKSATSSTVSVKVRPLITLSLVNQATGRFSTKVSAARPFAGKFLLVQRLTSTGVSTLKRVTLDSTSAATFGVRLHVGRSRLRVVMPTSQAAPGYITGTSNVVTVRH
jgi:hypothetical protein